MDIGRLTSHEAFRRWSDWAAIEFRAPVRLANAVGFVGAGINVTVDYVRNSPTSLRVAQPPSAGTTSLETGCSIGQEPTENSAGEL